MHYTVEFHREPSCYFAFENGEYTVYNTYEYDPISIAGTITVDDKKIGFLQIYELDNDYTFYSKCDGFSNDCATIAETICSEEGNVLKEHLPKGARYDVIYILDQIVINEEYRGQGIGSGIVKNLLQMLRCQYDQGCAIFLCASDFEVAAKYGFKSNEYLAGCKRLERFYKKAGYFHIKDNVFMHRN